jgi:predicted SprT family Zn-dependent metalloprotease
MTPGLHFTPETLAAAYTFLRTTKPFNRWKLPPAHDLKFRVTKSPTDAGYCAGNVIGLSTRCIAFTPYLMEIMAHEMIHLYLDRKGVKAHHGPEFQRCAKQVCAAHGFDPKRFF